MSNYDYDENGNIRNGSNQRMFGFGSASPFVRKVQQIKETDSTSCSYKGILLKIAFFMLLIAGGFVVDLLVHKYGGDIYFVDSDKGFTTTKMELYLAIACGIGFVFGTIIASFIRPTIPVAGSIAFFSIGYLVGMLGSIIPTYWDIILIALAVTFALVFSMAIVYATKIVKVDGNFYKVLFTLLGAYLLGGLIIMILYFVPATRSTIIAMINSRWWVLLIGAIVILIGCMFLLSDFNAIQRSVENNLPKKYEWMCAFSLTYTIVWIYLRVLDILARLRRD